MNKSAEDPCMKRVREIVEARLNLTQGEEAGVTAPAQEEFEAFRRSLAASRRFVRECREPDDLQPASSEFRRDLYGRDHV